MSLLVRATWKQFGFINRFLGGVEVAPVTMVTSVPWERERDITENSPLWELLPFNLSWSPIGSRSPDDWPIVAKHANMMSSRQYKCDARDNNVQCCQLSDFVARFRQYFFFKKRLATNLATFGKTYQLSKCGQYCPANARSWVTPLPVSALISERWLRLRGVTARQLT